MVLRCWRPPVVLEASDDKEEYKGERHVMGKLREMVRGHGEEGAHRKQLVRRRSPADGEGKR